MTSDSIAKHVIPQDSSAPQYDFVVATQSIAAVPTLNVEALYPVALSKHRSGDWTGAEQDYRNILAVEPNHAGANHFLGMLHFQRGQIKEALPFLKKAIQIKPNEVVYRNNYGVVLKELRRLEEAESAFQKAASLAPTYADARSNLGLVCLLKNDLKRAEYELESALTLEPNHLDAQKYLGELRFQQGEQFASQENFDKAADRFHQAAALPGGQKLWHWKPLSFCPSVFQDEESIEQYWNRLDEGLDTALQQNVPVPFETLPKDGFTPSFNLPHLNKCCRGIKEKFSRLFEKAFSEEAPKCNKEHSKIRIGFVVTAGHHHGFLRVYRYILEHIDTKKFEVFFFCPKAILDSCRQSVHNDNIRYIDIPSLFADMISTLRESRCDILYHWKVGGGTLDYFLAAAKAAPVQCTSLGTHGTSGVKAVDYYISTSYLEPPESAAHYTERLVLFDSYATAHPYDEPLQKPASRGELGLPEKGAVYFCPQRLAKYHPCFDKHLRLILEGDPNGILCLCTGRKRHLAEKLRERMRRSLGTDLMRRVRLLPSLPLDVYKKYLSAASCLLDSPVYAGDLTTHDALCQGVPVVTQEGGLLVQRYTTGIYRQLGLDSLIAADAESYARLAVRLGTELDYGNEIRNQIVERSRCVFASLDTVRAYEDFFERVGSE